MTWEMEFERTSGAAYYNAFYRYAEKRKSMLNFWYDLLPDIGLENDCTDDIDNQKALPEEPLKPDSKLFSYLHGNICQKTGILYYTALSPLYHGSLMELLEQKGWLPRIGLKPHTADIRQALKAADKKGYDRFAVQRHLRGAFRGLYLGSSICQDYYREQLLVLSLVGSERLWRVRDISVRYDRLKAEPDHILKSRALKTAPDQKIVRDGFAAFGTNIGLAFNFDGLENGEIGCTFSDYDFIRKGRRVSAMVSTPLETEDTAVPLNLALSPATIERSFNIMNFWIT